MRPLDNFFFSPIIIKMSIISRIWQAATHSDISPVDLAAIRAEVVNLRQVSDLLRPTKRIKKPAIKRQTEREFVDSSVKRVCNCGAARPHSTRAEFQRHMLYVKRRRMQKAASIYWHRVGYDKMGFRSGIVRRQKSIKLKSAIFRELAPHASTLLDVEKEVQKCVNPKDGGMLGYKAFRQWVRRHYT